MNMFLDNDPAEDDGKFRVRLVPRTRVSSTPSVTLFPYSRIDD